MKRIENRCPKFANSSVHHLPSHHSKAKTTPSLQSSHPHLNPPQAFASKQRSAAYIAVLNQTRTREGASSGFCGGFKRRRAKTGNRPAAPIWPVGSDSKVGGDGVTNYQSQAMIGGKGGAPWNLKRMETLRPGVGADSVLRVGGEGLREQDAVCFLFDEKRETSRLTRRLERPFTCGRRRLGGGWRAGS